MTFGARPRDPEYRFTVFQSLLAGFQDNYGYRGAQEARQRMEKDKPVFLYVKQLSALLGYHRLARRFGEQDEAEAWIAISGNGPGIPQEDQELIFDKFGQASSGRQRGGSGLGLAFCKLAVEAQKGRIGVASSPGMGSTFWFTLPMAESRNGAAAPQGNG